VEGSTRKSGAPLLRRNKYESEKEREKEAILGKVPLRGRFARGDEASLRNQTNWGLEIGRSSPDLLEKMGELSRGEEAGREGRGRREKGTVVCQRGTEMANDR